MIKQVDDDLYKIICEWWTAHGWPIVPREFLPIDGYIIFIGEKPVMAAFLYKFEDCKLSAIEWIVANPETSHEERTEVFTMLMNHLVELAKTSGRLATITFSRNKNLDARLIANGFIKTDENMTHYLKSTG